MKPNKKYTKISLYVSWLKDHKIPYKMELPTNSRAAPNFQSRITDNRFWEEIYALMGSGHIVEVTEGVFMLNRVSGGE